MMIRAAKDTDIEALTNIYNDAIINTTATFDLEPKTVEERQVWFDAHTGRHPLIVAEVKDLVVGYASLSTYREKEAYIETVELSIYVHGDYRLQGIGKALMKSILEMAKELPIHTVVSVITGGNMASDRLHKEFGFSYCGCVREAGRKFGKYLNIDTYQLMM